MVSSRSAHRSSAKFVLRAERSGRSLVRRILMEWGDNGEHIYFR